MKVKIMVQRKASFEPKYSATVTKKFNRWFIEAREELNEYIESELYGRLDLTELINALDDESYWVELLDIKEQVYLIGYYNAVTENILDYRDIIKGLKK